MCGIWSLAMLLLERLPVSQSIRSSKIRYINDDNNDDPDRQPYARNRGETGRTYQHKRKKKKRSVHTGILKQRGGVGIQAFLSLKQERREKTKEKKMGQEDPPSPPHRDAPLNLSPQLLKFQEPETLFPACIPASDSP
jgi:hypothetical protein